LNVLSLFCLTTFVNVFFSYRISLVEFWGSQMYFIISSVNSHTLISSSPFCFTLIAFSSVIVLARTASTLLNR
jgi:cbb3-type cytochrome oxidase subunit 1